MLTCVQVHLWYFFHVPAESDIVLSVAPICLSAHWLEPSMFSYTVYTTTIPLQQFVFYLVNLPAAHTFPLHYWNGLALTTCAPVCEASIVIRDSNIDDIFQTTYQLVLFNLQAASSSLSTEPLSIVDELPTVPKGLYWYGSNLSGSAFVFSPSSLPSSTSSLSSSLE